MKLGDIAVAGKATNIPFKQIAVQPDMASPEVWLEAECLLRFWKRRAFHAFTVVEAPAGEANYEIDLEHLAFALAKIKYYSELLAGRDSK